MMTISETTVNGVPLSDSMSDELGEKLRGLSDYLRSVVRGQEIVIPRVVSVLPEHLVQPALLDVELHPEGVDRRQLLFRAFQVLGRRS